MSTDGARKQDIPWEDPRRILSRHQLSPKKRFSQNFLVSQSIAKKIIAALEAQEPELIVEFGPGVGTLTRLLLALERPIVAVESDREMLKLLQDDLAGDERIELVQGDAAVFDLAALEERLKARPSVIANLPYASSGRILRRLAQQSAHLHCAVLMVQREVRDRLIAPPGSKTYGLPSIYSQAAFNIKTLFHVSAGSFYPIPKVQSSVILLKPHLQPRLIESESLSLLTSSLFSQRRKTLRNALSTIVPTKQAEELLAQAGIDSKRRPETLSIEELLKLHRHWQAQS